MSTNRENMPKFTETSYYQLYPTSTTSWIPELLTTSTFPVRLFSSSPSGSTTASSFEGRCTNLSSPCESSDWLHSVSLRFRLHLLWFQLIPCRDDECRYLQNLQMSVICHHEHSQVAPTLVQSSCKGQQCRQPDAFSLDKSDIYVSPSTKNTTILSRIPRKGRSVSYDVGGWQIPLTLWKRKSDQKDQMSKSCFFRNILEKGNDSFFHVFRIFMMMSNDFTLQGLHFPPCCCKQWKSTSNPNKEPPSLGLLSTFPKTRDFTCDLMWWTSSSLNDQF